MRDRSRFQANAAGVDRPVAGWVAPVITLLLGAAGLASTGCGDKETQRSLPSVQLAMTADIAPFYDDGELTLYEVRKGVQLPILAPHADEMAKLESEPMTPYGRTPWVTLSDVRVSLSWTLTNLDTEKNHNVELLVDPWNEFGRYYPGLQLVDPEQGQYVPNISGIDYLYELKGTGDGEPSRIHGTYTLDDMDELARDFATVMNIIQNPLPPLGGQDPNADDTVAFVNHTWAPANRSNSDPLTLSRVPPVTAGLVGYDIALRTREPAAVAVEVVVEVVDLGSGKVQGKGNNGALLPMPDQVITVGVVPP